MLNVFLEVLSILGIVLLCLLGLVVLAILLVLFFPVSYRLSAEKDAEQASVSARASWLFGFLRVSFSYPEPGRLLVKLLPFTVFDSGKKAGDKSNKASESRNRPEGTGQGQAGTQSAGAGQDSGTAKAEAGQSRAAAQSQEAEQGKAGTPNAEAGQSQAGTPNAEAGQGQAGTQDAETGQTQPAGRDSGSARNAEAGQDVGTGPNPAAGQDAEAGQNPDPARDGQPDSPDSEVTEENAGFPLFKKFKKIKYTICGIYDKIKNIWENISYYIGLLQEEDTKQLFSHAVFRLGKILKCIRPRHIRGQLLFGTGAPDTTGYAFGIYGMLSPCLGNRLQVTPDFARAVLEGNLYAAGHITVFTVLWNVFKVLMDKKLRAFIRKMKAGRKM